MNLWTWFTTTPPSSPSQ